MKGIIILKLIFAIYCTRFCHYVLWLKFFVFS